MTKTSSEYSRASRDRRKAAGQCIDCEAPNDGEHVRCAEHHAAMKRASNASRRERAAQGRSGERLCPSCGAELLTSECEFCGADAAPPIHDWDHYGAEVATTVHTKG